MTKQIGWNDTYGPAKLSARTDQVSKRFFVEEMAGDLPTAGREITAETPEEAVARVISDAVVAPEWEAGADEKWVRVTDSERGVIYRFQIPLKTAD
ncbi:MULTISPECIES: hypothetical protein [unclassified Mesorhizobium]|jgi:hypothetical protein|uniref:hypothetical protein n=1 Tax=unclassified Mesorhizobium TaxID=325217 RepID=UPI000FD99337|nr:MULTISPECIES: hypothetical protein [unclassified Mesorhizobium]TGQ17730.1 hypothetical protein EN862_009870 [Mesorhizobium sp. M2E.F.Ca.ET.219.01.1.1]TGS17280.1 hypothetical protein EN852_008835 [Mesorhizobium sp. M2E.F.Ca.ET.209.01.1.1]TGT64160.1 hypothetical protein EN809_034190 [Mesorhizobium sp. M2E.F.Ca.ET.166.01.1.1]TGV97107.1 hypothetical protein EN797_034200 [Mesorhizobium sp. M2E.F.Ca.ET.154.01.1.1]